MTRHASSRTPLCRGRSGVWVGPRDGRSKCHTFRGPHSTLDNVVSRVQHGFWSSSSARPPEMQALTFRLRARAALQCRNQMCVHNCVINGFAHTRQQGSGIPKTGHFDAQRAGRRRDSRRRSLQSAARRLTHLEQAWILNGDGADMRASPWSPDAGRVTVGGVQWRTRRAHLRTSCRT